MTAPKIRALVGCQNEMCAAEVSYHLDMVRMHEGQPICEECWKDGGYATYDEATDEFVPDWHYLPAVELSDLCE
jgi:hypothetical protein